MPHIVMPILVVSTTVGPSVELRCLFSPSLLPSPLLVYHVTENGWVQVWSGDTTSMYYEYYPLKVQKQIAQTSETSGGEEEMKVVS
jgi:hypothetical protein